jgi:hypothetical protein
MEQLSNWRLLTFFSLRYGEFIFLTLKNPFVGFSGPFFCRQVAKIRHHKKKPGEK